MKEGKRLKIALIRPKLNFLDYGSTVPPLGLAGIAACIPKKHKVIILDQPTMNTSRKELAEFFRKEKPDIVGFSGMTPEIVESAEEAEIARKELPKAKIVIGGQHSTVLPIETLKEFKVFDIAISGEGEEVFPKIVDALSKGKQLNFAGVAFRKGKGIKFSGMAPEIQDLDRLPLPAYALLPMEKYTYNQIGISDRKYFAIMSSRGCPYQCTFCSHAVFSKKVRFRSAENVLKEIDTLYNDYGVRAVGFLDDTFNINKQRLKEVCGGLIERKYDLVWACTARVNTIDEESIGWMKKAGCIKISFGVESGDPEMLERIKKGITLEQIEKAFKLAHRQKILTLAYMMINLPGETRKSIEASKKFIKKVSPDYIAVAILCPLPGSEIFSEHKKTLPKEWTRYQMTPFETLPVYPIGELNEQELQDELKSYLKSFYIRPGYAIGRLGRLKSMADLKFYIKKAGMVFKYWFKK